MLESIKIIVIALVLSFVFVACSGTSDDTNQPPVANAGADQTVIVGDEVTFNGGSSSDDGKIESYIWDENATELSVEKLFMKSDFEIGTHLIRLRVTDDQGETASDEVIITVNAPANLIPVALSQTLSVVKYKDINITLSATDEDEDNITFILETNPTNGTLSGTIPNLIYTPHKHYNGSDRFTFKVNDGTDDSNIATVDIDVTLISHNGSLYNTVVSPYTAKIWLDRNLGASRVCTSLDDKACIGDYYQWGRDTDGHESNVSEVNSTLAVDINNSGDDFIVSAISPYDWTTSDTNGSIRSLNWSKIDGSSVCPIGFRVPAIDELKDETLESIDGMLDMDDAFNNFLKLPLNSYRNNTVGTFNPKSTSGNIWSNSMNNEKIFYLYYYRTGSGTSYIERAMGLGVRCIKDVTIVADAGEDQSIYEGENVTLDGNGSYSVEGTIISYEWRDGNTTLSRESSFSKSDFTTGEHILILTVIDDKNNLSIDTLTIIIHEPRESVVHNGLTYYTISSPYTARVWLDRNIGAMQACVSFDDFLCYGDYYQWGRGSDGHEKIDANTTRTLASDFNNTGVDFIVAGVSPYDWITIDVNGSLRAAMWSTTDGSSVCPIDYRVPTKDELNAETIGSSDEMQNKKDVFNSFLKLPSVGYRSRGTVYRDGIKGGLWTGSISEGYENRSDYLYFDEAKIYYVRLYRTYGYPIRCIKGL